MNDQRPDIDRLRSLDKPIAGALRANTLRANAVTAAPRAT
jgi:hypothetical protein